MAQSHGFAIDSHAGGRAAGMTRCCILLLGCLLGTVAARADDTGLHIYGWPHYMDPAALAKFTTETGVKVRYDTYDSLALLESTLKLGSGDYDIIMPALQPTLSRLIGDNRLAEIDRAQVPNWQNLDPALMHYAEAADPGNRYGLIYLWGTLGLGILPARVTALAPDAPLDSLALLFDPRHASRLQSCGITMLDTPIAVVPTVLHYLGRPTDSSDPADLAAVEHTLMGIRPYIHTFVRTSALHSLASEATCLALAFSGAVLQAADLAESANNGARVSYVLPKGGALAEFDMLAIPANAPHKSAAHAFINFVLRPDIMAGISNATRYPNAVPASRSMIDPALLKDSSVFPSEANMTGFFTVPLLSQNATMVRNRLWARFKQAR